MPGYWSKDLLQRAVVANTDRHWFDFFRPVDRLTRVDEVNFWRPVAKGHFRALDTGEPFFFRLKHPVNVVAGFGFFALQSFLSVGMAWEVFGEGNGDPTRERFLSRIAGYRGVNREGWLALLREQLSRLVLREAVFLPERDWIPWGAAEEWARNIVAYKTVDLAAQPGRRLADLLQAVPLTDVADLTTEWEPVTDDDRLVAVRSMVERKGQGTFRPRVIAAYNGRCAVTRERALPALDAAHIQPYLGPASNHVQNGLLLRADLHRLYDSGYLAVTPDLRLEVSRRLLDDFDNGDEYYQMAGAHVIVPDQTLQQPSRRALEWHAEHVFR